LDERRFDALTKALVAAKPSRREALRRLAGGALATVFGGLALEQASAQVGIQRRACGQPCNGNGDCNAGLRCAARSEECLAIPSSGDRCTGNSDCSRNFETCNQNNDKCINTLAGRDCPECLHDRDCPSGQNCNNKGRCR
jgi:hypothetical protein